MKMGKSSPNQLSLDEAIAAADGLTEVCRICDKPMRKIGEGWTCENCGFKRGYERKKKRKK